MNMNALLKQAKNMQKKVDAISTDFDQKVFDFEDSNGIKLKIKGNLRIEEIDISEALLKEDNKEVLQDLLTITINKAIDEVGEKRSSALESVTGGLNLGGIF